MSKIISIIFSFSALFSLFLLTQCGAKLAFTQISDEDLAQKLAQKNIPCEVKRFQFEDYNTRYMEVGKNDSLPLLVALHGSPGGILSYENLYKDKDFLQKFDMLIFDRLGYGGSEFGKFSTSIQKQASAILPILRNYKAKNRKLFLVGSSYGGSVALAIAMQAPEILESVFFISSSLIPNEENIYWVSQPKIWKYFKNILPKGSDIRAAASIANEEKLTHTEALKEIQHQWEKINIPVGFLHGLEDNLVFPSNVKIACENLKNAPKLRLYTFAKQGHSLYWNYPEIVKNTLIEFYYKEILE
jgi:pimeloyl-ACP methyl ester carboxylesterase